MRKNADDWFYGFITLVLAVGLVATIILAATQSDDYQQGYCDALGGAVLNSETCNVEGRVVTIGEGN